MPNAADREALRQSLGELHHQLIQLEDVKPETEELLRTIAKDIDNVLDPKSPETGSSDLTSRWQEALLEFEGRHPQLTQTMDQITTALASIGL
jgi:hypothetical protein